MKIKARGTQSTKISATIFVLIASVVAYGFALEAIDTGRLLYYVAFFILLLLIASNLKGIFGKRRD